MSRPPMCDSGEAVGPCNFILYELNRRRRVLSRLESHHKQNGAFKRLTWLTESEDRSEYTLKPVKGLPEVC